MVRLGYPPIDKFLLLESVKAWIAHQKLRLAVISHRNKYRWNKLQLQFSKVV